MFAGSIDELIPAVRAVCCWERSQLVTAEKAPDWHAYVNRSAGERGRAWRLRTSRDITTEAKTIRSPHFAGWGAADVRDIPRLVGRLTHADPCVRCQAINDLSSMGPAANSALPDLWNRFTDREPRLRILAADAALHIDADDPRPLLAIVLELRNPAADVRRAAVRCLVPRPELAAPFLPQLLAAFEREQSPYDVNCVALLGSSSDAPLRQKIAGAIARKIRTSIDPSDVPVPQRDEPLAIVLANGAGERRAGDVEETPPPIADIGEPPLPTLPLVGREGPCDPDFLFYALRVLAQLGPDSAPAFVTLKSMVRSGIDPFGRAAEILARFAPDGPRWLAGQMPRLPREQALLIAFALGDVGKRGLPAVPEIRKLLDVQFSTFRCRVARALMMIDAEGEGDLSLGALWQVALHADEQPDRAEALRILAEFDLFDSPKSARQRPALLKALCSGLIGEQSAALRQLTEQGSAARAVAPELWRMLKIPRPELQGELIVALWRIDGYSEAGGFRRDTRPILLDRLRRLLRADDAFSRVAALQAIAEIGEPARVLAPDVVKCLDARKTEEAAIGAVRALGPAAKTAIPKLILLSDRDEPNLQSNAIAALCRVGQGHPAGVQRLKEWCETEGDLSILKLIEPADLGGQKITPVLVQVIRSWNGNVVYHARELLRATDPEAACNLEKR